MYQIQTFVLYALTLCLSFVSVSAASDETDWYARGNFKPETRVKILLRNKLVKNRMECPVVIKRQDMPVIDFYAEWLTVIDPNADANDNETNGSVVYSQTDDTDKDGIWDELFFLVDLKARETKTLYVYVGRNSGDAIEHRTHVEIGSYGRHTVPWWESEYMGWKFWFPDSADMYGRREKKLVSNLNITKYYGHNAPNDAGIDIMLVGKTFGAGGVCLFEETAHPDSVSRPRFNLYEEQGPINNIRYACDIIANGPLRSIVRVHVMNWRTGKGTYEYDQYITAYMNKYYYTCAVRFLKFFPREDGVSLGCGIRKMPRESQAFRKGNAVVSSTDDLMNVITPLDDDPGLKKGVKEFLGLGLIVRDCYKPEYHAIDGFEGNYVFRIPVTDDLKYEYLVAGAWSEGLSLTSHQEFTTYLLDTAVEYNNPPELESITLEKKE